MSRTCEICHRGPSKKTNRSHSHIANRRWVHINLQSKRIDGKKVNICTRCIKTRTKQLTRR